MISWNCRLNIDQMRMTERGFENDKGRFLGNRRVVCSVPSTQSGMVQDEEMRKVERGESAEKTVQVQDTFILPVNVIDSWGGIRVMFDPCKEIADKYGLSIFKSQ